MIIKVFISHAKDDIKLAKILKKQLKVFKKIEIFMYEYDKKYGDEIVKKLTDEIEESDYLIAIMTDVSASVHQEIGYAKGVGAKIIPMAKKDADKGFMIYGTDTKEFTYDNFKEKCINIAKYIIKQGPQLKVSIKLIKKGAYYRHEINENIIDFLLNIIKILNIKNKQIMKINKYMTMEDKYVTIDDRFKIQIIIMDHFWGNEINEIINSHKIDLKLWNKLIENNKILQNKMEKTKEHLHTNLPHTESELIGKIQRHISTRTWSENLNKKEQKIFLNIEIEKMKKLLVLTSNLVGLYIDYEIEFKEKAFKTIYDD